MHPCRWAFSALIVIALSACQHNRYGAPATVSQGPAESTVAAGQTEQQAPALSPIDDYRHARLARAMAGLKYDSGLVEIDGPVAARIVAGRDAQQAAAEYASGRQLLEQGLFVEAIAAHTKAVLLDPQQAEYYDGLAVALITRGRVEQALAAYRTCLSLDDSRVETRFRMGYALQMLGRLEEAVAEWSKVVEQQPAHGEAHSRLAIGYYYLGDYPSAWRHTHAAEAAGFAVPPQFRELLRTRLAEPG